MAVTQDNFGVSETIPLVPNGENIEVTNDNKLAYIMYYANYMLNARASEQTGNFVKGLKSVFTGDELSIFYPNEIQLLISGGVSEIDIDDLRANSKLNRFKPE